MEIAFSHVEFELTILIAAFFAALVGEMFGAIAGGGGFFTQPLLIALGVPPHMALANDVSATMGSGLSGTYVYHKNKRIPYRIAKWWIPGLIIGPFIGVEILVVMSPDILEDIVAGIALSGAVFLFLRKHTSDIEKTNLPSLWKTYAFLMGLFTGTLVGFGIAGVGMITSMLMFGVLRLSLKETIGAKQVLMFIPALAATIGFIAHGLISIPLLIALFTGATIGGYMGSSWVVKMDVRLLKKVFTIAIILIAVWVLYH